MYVPIRMATWALIFSTLLIFCIVPIAILFFGHENIIFYRGEIGTGLILFNASLAIPLLVGLFFFKNQSLSGIQNAGSLRTPLGFYVLVLGWMIVYVSFGGLEYRDFDVKYGYDARSWPLKLSLTFNNIIALCTAALLIETQGKKIWKQSTLIAVFLIFIFVLSGSRGIVLQLLLTIWVSFFLKNTPISNGLAKHQNLEIPSMSMDSVINKSTFDFNFFSKKNIVIGALLILILGAWGVFRDNQEDILFSTLYRASEPFWHHAFVHFTENGNDISILWDSLDRIISIPGRWLGLTYESSIDGAELILDQKLGIVPSEGVSLPITYVGEGFLFHGYSGAIFFQILVYGIVIASFYFLKILKGVRPSLFVALVAFQVVKCIFLYPKSVSGVFLVMFYETTRDYILLLAVSFFLKMRSRVYS
jgi:hypothetical protein